MTDTYDPLPDLGRLLDAALRAGRDGTVYAKRIADGIGLKAWPGPEAAEKALREALGIPAPVTYDPTDEFSVMDAGYQTVRTVPDRYGKLTEVGRVGAEAVVIPPPGIGALFYTPAEFAVLREALDRAAMPGQEASGR